MYLQCYFCHRWFAIHLHTKLPTILEEKCFLNQELLIHSYMCKPVQSTKYKVPYANLSFNISSAQGSMNVHHLKILFCRNFFSFQSVHSLNYLQSCLCWYLLFHFAVWDYKTLHSDPGSVIQNCNPRYFGG